MKSDSSLGPRTIVGRWLLATILGHEDQRDQLVTRLNEDESKWRKYDEPAVVEVACWLAIRRLLPANADETQPWPETCARRTDPIVFPASMS
jgi:hypothetical protein